MEIPLEVIKWLKNNAYAVKEKDYWFLSDFPPDMVPEKLEIPMRSRMWKLIVKITTLE